MIKVCAENFTVPREWSESFLLIQTCETMLMVTLMRNVF